MTRAAWGGRTCQMMTMGAMGGQWGDAEKCSTFWNSLRGEEDLDIIQNRGL